MHLTREPIDLKSFLTASESDSAGASVLFLGTVRNHSEGRSVLYLEYEAYETMAERMIADCVAFAQSRWNLRELQVIHRLGAIVVGEVAVAIEVKSDHRHEAYEASRYLIEAMKHKVPIWKKEYFADGASEWSQCRTVEKAYADLSRSTSKD